MHKKSASRSTLFLMELMMVVFIFALCAAVCMRLFGAAYSISSDSDDLNHATALSKTAASCYKAAEGDLALWCRLMDLPEELTTTAVQTGIGTIYYDKDWQRTDTPCQEGFYLCAVPEQTASEALKTARILVCHTDGEEIFQLSVKKAVPDTGGDVHAP